VDCAARAGPGTGAIVAVFSGDAVDEAWDSTAWWQISADAAELGGYATPAPPRGWPSGAPPVPSPRAQKLSERLKLLFDPAGILPGPA